jgi:hypothetical protein
MPKRTSYAARRAQPVLLFSCSSLQTPYLQLRDAVAAWETFDESALEKYMATGIKALRLRIHQLSDLSRPLGEQQRKELLFMLESLLYVRSVLTENTEITMDGAAER